VDHQLQTMQRELPDKGVDMDYKGYEIIEKDKSIVVKNLRDFHPVHVFDCGQCFRWIRQEDGSYTGVAKGRVVNAQYDEGVLVLNNSTLQDFIDIWYDYFDLGRDYSEIKTLLCKDDIMREAISYGHGIRLLRQDIWETLVSFIISANNMIPRIKKTVGVIASIYGDKVSYDGSDYHTFPPVEKLSDTSVEQLDVCRGGFRCKYIINSSMLAKTGEIDLKSLAGMKTGDARKELMRFPGVGPKVADCVLLYSGTKYDVFPTDVWVKRVMEELYFKREASFREIQEFAAAYFGELAGFAQQYLFFYARENRIGV